MTCVFLVVAKIGGTFSVPCKIFSDSTVEVAWFRLKDGQDNVIIAHLDVRKNELMTATGFNIMNISLNNGSLVIQRVNETSKYMCVTKTKDGQTNSVKVVVHALKRGIHTYDSQKLVEIGQSIDLSCDVQADIDVLKDIRWYKEDKLEVVAVLSVNGNCDKHIGYDCGQKRGTMTIFNLTETAVYSCVAKNGNGEVFQYKILLQAITGKCESQQ